jgi:hypothetical protein
LVFAPNGFLAGELNMSLGLNLCLKNIPPIELGAFCFGIENASSVLDPINLNGIDLSLAKEDEQEIWNPDLNLTLPHWAQTSCLLFDDLSSLILEKENLQLTDSFWIKQHHNLIATLFDTAISWAKSLHFDLLLFDEVGHYESFENPRTLERVLEAKSSFPGNIDREQLWFHYLGKLQVNYPDLPIGLDLYTKEKHPLDAMHISSGNASPHYGSFSLWQVLRKVLSDKRNDSLPLDRLWFYALDLGVHAARLIVIDVHKPLGKKILNALRNKSFDSSHRLYTSFHIYLGENHLFALLRDEMFYTVYDTQLDDRLKKIPLSWRPESFMGNEYRSMELLHIPLQKKVPASSAQTGTLDFDVQALTYQAHNFYCFGAEHSAPDLRRLINHLAFKINCKWRDSLFSKHGGHSFQDESLALLYYEPPAAVNLNLEHRWVPNAKSNLSYFAQQGILYHRDMPGIVASYVDTVSFLMTHLRPQLLFIGYSHELEPREQGLGLSQLLSAQMNLPFGPSPVKGLSAFLDSLELKYPDLPIGKHLFDRPSQKGGADVLDLIQAELNTLAYDPAYASFSLWQVLRKVIFHRRYQRIPHERLWSYALDLGIHAARLVAIDATKPLGEQIQTAIREGTYDCEHYLYRSFYIYLHGDYLMAVLSDDIEYWMFDSDVDLRHQPVSWRPESLAGYDYSQMELLYTPPPAEPEGPGWYLRRTGFERVSATDN